MTTFFFHNNSGLHLKHDPEILSSQGRLDIDV